MEPHPALPYRSSSLLWPPFPANKPNSIHLLPSSCGLVDATSPILHLRRSSICATPTKPSRLSYFSRRTARASPPPPPPSEDPNTIAGIQATLSRIQDRLRIFFAVFFWMSLFFWGSAWDGRNDARKKKGPWFRK